MRGFRPWRLSVSISLSILSSQLVDHPPAASLGSSPLGNMIPLASQSGTVALVAWEFSIAADPYITLWSVLKLKLCCWQPGFAQERTRKGNVRRLRQWSQTVRRPVIGLTGSGDIPSPTDLLVLPGDHGKLHDVGTKTELEIARDMATGGGGDWEERRGVGGLGRLRPVRGLKA